jgi:hypothetical protein
MPHGLKIKSHHRKDQFVGNHRGEMRKKFSRIARPALSWLACFPQEKISGIKSTVIAFFIKIHFSMKKADLN